MPHETRRSAREAAARDAAVRDRASSARRAGHASRRARRRAVWIILAVVLIAVLGAATWVAFRALTVKSELEAAQALVGSLDDGMPMADRLAVVGGHAEKAAGEANDPLWRASEWVPFAGDNLRAVRLASESLDLLANRVGTPALEAMADKSGPSPLASVLSVLDSEGPAVSAMADQVADAAASASLIGPVRKGIDQVNEVLSVAKPMVSIVPTMLGIDEQKNYLLVFQNNAESTALGGSAASQTLLTADKGKIAIAAQASSGSFANGTPVDVKVDQSALDLYSNYLIDHVNTATSRPDFPTAAQILKAFWQRDIRPDRVDGVISIDPIALGRVLKATGPITVTGPASVGQVEMNETNAVSILLKDAYDWWNPYANKAQALASDAFFAGVATEVFAKVSGGDFDLKDMAWAIKASIDNGDIMAWSDDPEVASMLSGQRVAGTLPLDNAGQTTVGVFFRDTSASKIDYYIDSTISLDRACTSEASTFTASASLHLDLTQAQTDALPPYVKSARWGAQQFRTEVFIYGPPGTTFVSATTDGRDVSPVRTDIDDLGRPVASFQSFLQPGETDTITAEFSGSGTFGPLQVRSTPMIRASKIAVNDACG